MTLLMAEVWQADLWATLKLLLMWRLLLTGERERRAEAPSPRTAAVWLVKEPSLPKWTDASVEGPTKMFAIRLLGCRNKERQSGWVQCDAMYLSARYGAEECKLVTLPQTQTAKVGECLKGPLWLLCELVLWVGWWSVWSLEEAATGDWWWQSASAITLSFHPPPAGRWTPQSSPLTSTAEREVSLFTQSPMCGYLGTFTNCMWYSSQDGQSLIEETLTAGCPCCLMSIWAKEHVSPTPTTSTVKFLKKSIISRDFLLREKIRMIGVTTGLSNSSRIKTWKKSVR